MPTTITNPGTLIVTHPSPQNVVQWRIRTYNANDLVTNLLEAKGTEDGNGNWLVSLAATRAAVNAPNQGQSLQINVAGVNPGGESSATGAPEFAIFWNAPVAPSAVQIAQ